MLALSFFDNYAATIATAHAFGRVNYNHHVVLGLETERPRSEVAIVLCVDEKSQVQALNRTQPILPLAPACRLGNRTTTSATELHRCSQPWMWHPE